MRTVWLGFIQWFMTLSMQEWFYVLVGTVAFGAFCMRGFGSRSHY